jgi:hypothetical protein
MGALNNLQFTGDDFFAEKDVCSIALEVPNSALGSGTMGLWHRTVDGTGGQWVQADRGALASQSVFLPGDEKAAYQAGQPADDARFIPSSRTRWSTRVGIRLRKQDERQGSCCRTSSLMIPASRRPILPMAGH